MTDETQRRAIPGLDFDALRAEMVLEVEAHAAEAAPFTHHPVISGAVLDALGVVPRHEFVPREMQPLAYLDSPLPIGFEKTISQPYIVALMTDLLEIRPTDRVLDVGTGLGYQAAVLSRLAAQVCCVELIEELATSAAQRLRGQGYTNLDLKVDDGRRGWPERAPFDKILVAAAPDLIPPTLVEQLRPGGRMVVPAGLVGAQQLILIEKDAAGHARSREVLAVRFSELD